MKLFRTLAVFFALLIPAFATQNLQNVTVDAPVTLTTEGPETRTATSGEHYTQTTYSGELSNGDVYMVSIGKYPFQLTTTTNDDMTQGFIKGTAPNAKVLNSRATTLSGLPAQATVVEVTKDGRTLRIFVIVTYRGDTAYIIAFGTWMDTQGTDNAVVARFFSDVRINVREH